MNHQTSGPWVVLGRENTVGDIGIGPANRQAFPVAIVQEGGREGEARDNASLIAAAPELADALEALYGTYAPGKRFAYPDDHPQTLALAALRKAGRLPDQPAETAAPSMEPEPPPAPAVIDLMEALKASLAASAPRKEGK